MYVYYLLGLGGWVAASEDEDGDEEGSGIAADPPGAGRTAPPPPREPASDVRPCRAPDRRPAPGTRARG